MATLRVKRGTRAQLNAAAAADWLSQGEPYLITDEGRLAVGTGSDSYEPMAKQSEAGGTSLSASTSIAIVGTEIRRAALTGDVTSAANSNATTIANGAVTNAKMANMSAATIKGRAVGAGTGAPTDLVDWQVRQLIQFEESSRSSIANTVVPGDGIAFETIGAGSSLQMRVHSRPAALPAYSERGGGQWEGTDFYGLTATNTPPFTTDTALSSGTSVYDATYSARIIRSSTTANSGRIIRTQNAPRVLDGPFSMRCVLRGLPGLASRATLTRFGALLNGTYTATETTACAIDITTDGTGNASFLARGNGTTTVSLATTNVFGGPPIFTAGAMLILDFDVHSGGAVFTVSDADGVCYGAGTLATGAGWSTTNLIPGIKATHNGTTAGDVAVVDYMGLGPGRTRAQQRPLAFASSGYTATADVGRDFGTGQALSMSFYAAPETTFSDPLIRGPLTAVLKIRNQSGCVLPSDSVISTTITPSGMNDPVNVEVTGSFPGDLAGNFGFDWWLEWADQDGRWSRTTVQNVTAPVFGDFGGPIEM